MGRLGGAAAAEVPLGWGAARALTRALDALRRRGNHAETSLDLAAAALRMLELKLSGAGLHADEHHRLGSAAPRRTDHPAPSSSGSPPIRRSRDHLDLLVRANVDNPTDGMSLAAPGTPLASLAMAERTGEPRLEEEARESAAARPRTPGR